MNYIETFRWAPININASGDNTIITIGSGQMPAGWDNSATYIAIDHINLVPAGIVIMTLKSGKASGEGTQSNYSGPYPLTTSQGFVLENAVRNEHGIITMAPNQSFIINLSGAVQVSGFVRYRLVNTN